jgi:hypothetical protein
MASLGYDGRKEEGGDVGTQLTKERREREVGVDCIGGVSDEGGEG